MNVTVFSDGQRREIPSPDLAGLLQGAPGVVWVDMTGPEADDVRVMEEVFRFHPLAIEDSCNGRQRPKIEAYQDHVFVILNPADLSRGDLDYRELDVFLGSNYLVTVHAAPEPVIDEAMRRLENGAAQVLDPGYLLYILMDVVVDGYFPVRDWIDDELDRLGDLVLINPNREALRRLLAVKGVLVQLARVAAIQVDIFDRLRRDDYPPSLHYLFEPALQYHLRDVQDHLLRVTTAADGFRELLNTLISLHMSAVSNRLGRVVNRLAAITIIVGVMAVVTGFYGMNFDYIWPPHEAEWSVPAVLLMMLVAGASLYYTFRRRRWL